MSAITSKDRPRIRFIRGGAIVTVLGVSSLVAAPAVASAHGPGGGGRGLVDLDVAADTLGITEDELEELIEEGDSIADVAEDSDVELQAVIDALVADAEAEVDEAVAEGDLDADDATDIRDVLAGRITDAVERDGGFGGRGGRGDRGGRGGGRRGHGPGGGGRGLVDLDVAADTLGITEDELEELIEEGDSIADVAEDSDVELQAVIDALVADAEAEVDEAVAEGDLDADDATDIRDVLAGRITDAVERDGGFGHGPGRGPHRR